MLKTVIKHITKFFAPEDIVRILFGMIWIFDGSLAFLKGASLLFENLIISESLNQPKFLSGFFSFWVNAVKLNPNFYTYLIGVLSIILGIAIIFGFLKKTTYFLGVVFSLLIWAVGEGFGGPYVAGTTDISAGPIYAIVFLLLILIYKYKRPRIDLDRIIGYRIKWWKIFAEI